MLVMIEISMSTTLHLTPMDTAGATEIVAWRYEPPYDVYNIAPEFAAEGVAALLNPNFHYYTVHDEHDELIAFRCFGADARVMGGSYTDDALDMGGGLRPDLTGRGLGPQVLRAAIKFACTTFAPTALRVTVAGWNGRALQACAKVGFQRTGQFGNPATGVQFVVLTREIT